MEKRIMDDDGPRDDSAGGETTAGQTDPTPAARAPRKRRWGVLLFGIFIILPILLIALWTTITINWAYSRGERAGYVQKFSDRGWLCKTWEGEIAMVNMPGQAQEKFAFSVRDDSIAKEITRLMGSRVALTYEQHRGVPLRCFGDTEYYVVGVKAIP
jgi:hypothetical protein